uniref:Uncharacterized protein n=1 Tax=Anguilla anguilla TaxID=7936 RepID=A0A0E9PLA7_ANGAN
MKFSGYVSGTYVDISCKFCDDWPNDCWSIYVLSHALLNFIGTISYKTQ